MIIIQRVTVNYCTILSISDVHGQGLFFSPLREPLVFNSPRFKNSGHMTIFLWLCSLQNTDHVVPFWFGTTKMASHDQCFANHKAATPVSRDQNF